MKKILVFNFYKGFIFRGIPVQMDNMCAYMDDQNIEYDVVSCPKWLRNFPTLGLIFLFYEQLVMPLKGLRYDIVIYPFNSISIFAPFHSGSLLIVHDFIQNRRKFPSYYKSIAFVVRLTQKWYSLFGGDVAFITETVKKQAGILNIFKKSRQFILPNIFILFKHEISECHLNDTGDSHKNYILFCTGKVITKGLKRAIDLMSSIPPEYRLPIKVLGLGGDVDFFNSQAIHLSKDIDIEVLPLLDEKKVVQVYLNSRFVWVHSNQEGFGRNVSESLLAKKKVLASDIPPFKHQSASGVFFYNNFDTDSFLIAYSRCFLFDDPLQEINLEAESIFSENFHLIINN